MVTTSFIGNKKPLPAIEKRSGKTKARRAAAYMRLLHHAFIMGRKVSIGVGVAASYIAETVDTFAQADDPSELIYRLLDRTTEALLDGAAPLRVVAYAEVWMLRLAGILPSLRNCMECHELLGRPLRFDVRANGFVCSNCAGRDADVVPNAVADAIDGISRSSVADFAALDMPADVLFEIRALAGHVRRHFLGHELKSYEVLAGVSR